MCVCVKIVWRGRGGEYRERESVCVCVYVCVKIVWRGRGGEYRERERVCVCVRMCVSR